MNLVLTHEKHSKTLFVSTDGGANWKMAHRHVQDYFWSSFIFDRLNTVYVLHRKTDTSGLTNEDLFSLSKSEDGCKTWKLLLENVRKIWVPETMKSADSEEGEGSGQNESYGRFLYASHFINIEKQILQLSVSSDGGNTFRQVHLPTVISAQFFSVLDIEKDSVFIHVDEPGNTGFGTLYVSDSTGTVFTESLRRHFYPNNAPVHDFYRVWSMSGTFLTSQLNPDKTLSSVITHDRGATWHPLPVPQGLSCETTDPPPISLRQDVAAIDPLHAVHSALRNDSKEAFIPVCGLQVSNQFSLRWRVKASAPLSTLLARGLILVHGHVSTHLRNTPADVFISTNGGYTWHKGLDGPHHYQIANRGGLIVAVPEDTSWVEILRFSTDGGRCWHNINLTPFNKPSEPSRVSLATSVPTVFTSTVPMGVPTSPPTPYDPRVDDESVVFTGLNTEPGGRAMTVAVYGYGSASLQWKVAVVDFANNGLITNNCSTGDYELWHPHRTDTKAGDPNNGCVLGVKEMSYRLKEDSVCFSHIDFRLPPSYEICECTELDYECDFGFWRELGGDSRCVVNPHAPAFDICDLVGKEVSEHFMELIGYRLIPGNRCKGGWQPPHSNLSFEERTIHCPSKEKSLSLQMKTIIISVAILITIICTLTFLWIFSLFSRGRCNWNRHPYSQFLHVFQCCLQYSRLQEQDVFKPSVAPTVFYVSKGQPAYTHLMSTETHVEGVLGTDLITNHSPDRLSRCEDRLDLLYHEECPKGENSLSTRTPDNHLIGNQHGLVNDLPY